MFRIFFWGLNYRIFITDISWHQNYVKGIKEGLPSFGSPLSYYNL